MLGDVATLDLAGDVHENEGVGGGAFDRYLRFAFDAGFSPSWLVVRLPDRHNS